MQSFIIHNKEEHFLMFKGSLSVIRALTNIYKEDVTEKAQSYSYYSEKPKKIDVC